MGLLPEDISVIHKKVYVFNGKPYDSLDQIPEEFRSHFTNILGFETVKDGVNVSVDIQTNNIPSVNRLAIGAKYIAIAGVYAVSLAENVAINQFVAGPLNIQTPHVLISFVISLIIGCISHKLAEKEIKLQIQEGKSIEFTGSLSNFNDLLLTQISAKYSFLLYIPIYIGLGMYQFLFKLL